MTLPVGVSARPRGPALMRSSGGWNTRPLCASRGQSTRLWTPRRPKGKRCLPLWAHKTPTTRYESGIFNCAALCMFGHFFFFFTNYFYLICYWLQQNDYQNTSAQALLDPLGVDWARKHSSLSVDLNPKENSATEESGSENIEDGRKTQTFWILLNSHL